MVELIPYVISALSLMVSSWALITRRRIVGVSKRPDHPVQTVLDELLIRSRASGGRVHIHDVEETIRRHLG